MVKSDSPEKIEAAVTAELPAEYWTNFSHLLIQHGRKVCSSRNPSCSNCVLSEICKKTAVKI
jgi:endonuclease-3